MSLEHVTCDICGSDKSLFLFDRGRNQEQVTHVLCGQCGLVFVNPRKSAAKIQSHYTSGEFSLKARGSSWPSQLKFSQSEQIAVTRFRTLNDCVSLKSIDSGKVLEIGCGVGSFLRLMRGMGWDVLGIEPDANYAIAGGQEYGIPIRAEIFEETRLDSSDFDMVCLFHVIEHVESPSGLLRRIWQTLTLNGVLFLECPCIEKPYGGDLESFFWSDHLFTFSQNTMRGLLAITGFNLIRCGYSGPFLWVIAQKTERNLTAGLVYPLDDPNQVLKRTLRRYWFFKTLRPLRRGRVWPVLSRGRSLLLIVRYHPRAFLPSIKRETQRQLSPVVNAVLALPQQLKRKPSSRAIVHVGLHQPGNAGDTVLFSATRQLFDKINGPYQWREEHLWDEVSQRIVKQINSQGRALLLGGGGVLLPDTNRNDNSGWQWNCSLEYLKAIEVPIIVWAIGYNRFRGQDDFEPIFRTHITEMVRRSAFFGLRNRGSIRALSSYLPEDLRHRLSFQPCSTTLLSYLYPVQTKVSDGQDPRCMAINVAFDRARLRYGVGEEEDSILSQISRVLRWANVQGWKIYLVIHTTHDYNITPWLIKYKVDYTEVQLTGVPANEVIEFYRTIPLTIGTRGHSQLIPFGLQKRIISLISHDKLGWFLDDIGHPEWGIEVRDNSLESKLKDKIQEYGVDRRTEIDHQVVASQHQILEITMNNMKIIREAIS